MSVIEKLRNKKGTSTGISVCMIVLAGLIFAWNSRSGIPGDVKRAFYTVDEGDTYFVDDLNKVYPFDHNGKQAYRAYVFKVNGSGKTFVGFLERLNSNGQAKMSELVTQPHDIAMTEIAQVLSTCTEIKRPHSDKWAPVNSSAYGAIMNAASPDGDHNVQCINP